MVFVVAIGVPVRWFGGGLACCRLLASGRWPLKAGRRLERDAHGRGDAWWEFVMDDG